MDVNDDAGRLNTCVVLTCARELATYDVLKVVKNRSVPFSPEPKPL